jgi:hypothetical protein
MESLGGKKNKREPCKLQHRLAPELRISASPFDDGASSSQSADPSDASE